MYTMKVLALVYNIYFISFLVYIFPNGLFAQTSFQASGTVKEHHTQEMLEDAVITFTSLTAPSVTGSEIVQVDGYDITIIDSTNVGVVDDPHLPGKFSLSQNYPNPYNPVTMIPFSVEKAGHYTLKSFNLIGQEVFSTSVDLQPGDYSIRYGGGSANGVEFVRVNGEGYGDVIKLISPDGGDGSGFGRVGGGNGSRFLSKTARDNPMDFLVEISGDGIETYRDTVTLEEGANIQDFNDVLLSDYNPFFTDDVPDVSFDEDTQEQLDLNSYFEYYGTDALTISLTDLPSWINYNVDEGVLFFDPDTNAKWDGRKRKC